MTEPKVEHVKHKKEEAMNQALNTFQLNGGSLMKSGQTSQNGTRKDTLKSTTKSGQMGVNRNTTNNILSSVGIETLVNTKIAMPKISVIRK